MTFHTRIANLKVALLAQESTDADLTQLLEDAVRYRAALLFYAERKNYLDGSPMLGSHDEDDNGFTARRALKLDDYHNGPHIVLPNAEEEAPIAA
jgi:hypothetical protein